MDRVANALIEMTSYARTNGRAVIEIRLYGEKDGTVRTIITRNKLEDETFYQKSPLEDD